MAPYQEGPLPGLQCQQPQARQNNLRIHASCAVPQVPICHSALAQTKQISQLWALPNAESPRQHRQAWHIAPHTSSTYKNTVRKAAACMHISEVQVVSKMGVYLMHRVYRCQ